MPHPKVAEFAKRIAALLQTRPEAELANAVPADLARDVFGSSAGHARDVYDAVEAGMNIHLRRGGIRFSKHATKQFARIAPI